MVDLTVFLERALNELSKMYMLKGFVSRCGEGKVF